MNNATAGWLSGAFFGGLRARGPLPHRDKPTGLMPRYIVILGAALSAGALVGLSFLATGFWSALPWRVPRRRRPRRLLHAGPQGAHRPLAEGTTGARGGLLHGLLQRWDCGVLRASGRRPGVVRVARRLPVHGRRADPLRHRPCDAGRAAGAGGCQERPPPRAGLPPGFCARGRQ